MNLPPSLCWVGWTQKWNLIGVLCNSEWNLRSHLAIYQPNLCLSTYFSKSPPAKLPPMFLAFNGLKRFVPTLRTACSFALGRLSKTFPLLSKRVDFIRFVLPLRFDRSYARIGHSTGADQTKQSSLFRGCQFLAQPNQLLTRSHLHCFKASCLL